MSDEEDESVSEGFSASEDEWKPSKDTRGGESSDDDDSDFEESPAPTGKASAGVAKKKEQKQPSGIKGISLKKRKPTGQSLRAKLYNKYRPPPKTFPTSSTNSPTASSSNRITASKNAKTPNESGEKCNDDSSSESSVEDYLVNPADLDLGSSFFSAISKSNQNKAKSPVPNFDCNAGINNLSDSDSEDNNDSSLEDNTMTKAFDFRNLLENANSLERAKETLAKRTANSKVQSDVMGGNTGSMDVKALLALGENQNSTNASDELASEAPSKLSKTKSTRVKRHTKTRPASTVVAAGDSDDSDWEEVAGASQGTARNNQSEGDNSTAVAELSRNGDIEIHVEFPTKHQRTKQQKTQNELELALKRKLNRDIKDRQLLMHKTSLLCWIGRSYCYNRLLNSNKLMQAVLKLLPTNNVYPTERGTELKYFQSFVTWFKAAIKLTSPNMFPQKCGKKKSGIIAELLSQIEHKEARCKHDMILIFIILVRAMGIHCRLVVNMQPLPLRPAANELISIKLKKDEVKSEGNNKTESGVIETKSKTKDESAEVKKLNKISDKNCKTEKTLKLKKQDSEDKKTKSKSEEEANKNSLSTTLKNVTKSVKLEEEKPQTSKTDKMMSKPTLSKLKRSKTEVTHEEFSEEESKNFRLNSLTVEGVTPIARRTRQAPVNKKEPKVAVKDSLPTITIGSPVIPKLVLKGGKVTKNGTENSKLIKDERDNRSRSKSPKMHISPTFLQTKNYKETFLNTQVSPIARPKNAAKTKLNQINNAASSSTNKRALRTRQQKDNLNIPQLDGADDKFPTKQKRPKLEKLQKSISKEESDDDFEPSPPKRPKKAPILPKAVQNLRKDRRVLSTDDEIAEGTNAKSKATSSDMWIEVWSDVEEEWICIDLSKGKLHCIDTIRKAASTSLAYVFAFQNDLSLKDVTARYCPHWTTTVRKSRVEKSWLDDAIASYLGRRTPRDIREDQELRRIHEQKPMPTAISDYKDHPLYALERHILKFQAIYPPDAPTLGFVRKEPVYSRDCVHTLHSREIWLKQARTVKLGEQPYKIVKARPKWDRLTQTVIKDQPLEIFGYWQTQDYEPPTAENGIVPRNAYGNVELFKECMLPKKTAHLRLTGLNRICKKLGIDCANAVIGFDFHQGACHPTYDGFVICEEFVDQVTAAWYQDQEDQERKEQEKYEARVYGNWKKLVKGLLIRERLKKKYNF